MVMDRFTIDNEGTYTVQIQDGKAKNQSSLVLIGDGMFTETLAKKLTSNILGVILWLTHFLFTSSKT